MRLKGRGDNEKLRVWDPLVRIAHWSLVGAVAVSWVTRHGGTWHEATGYTALVIVGVRLLWGFFGSRHARFSDFVRGYRATMHYAKAMLRGTEPRHAGHNPLGGWMIMSLMGTVACVGLSGWLYTTDRFWGVAWVETVHAWSTYVLLGLVALHVGGVLYTSWRHRENLVAAMVTGRKRVDACGGKAAASRHAGEKAR